MTRMSSVSVYQSMITQMLVKKLITKNNGSDAEELDNIYTNETGQFNHSFMQKDGE